MKYFVPMLDFGPDPIVVEAEIDGLPANLLIDTGTPGTVLFPSRLRDRQHRPETQRLRPEKVPEGNTIIREITLQQLRIGAWSRKYVRVTAFADPPPRLPPVDGLLSLQTLGCRRICFDFSRKAVSWQ